MSQPESKLSRKIIYAIVAQGGFAFKIHGGSHMLAGLPDIIACVDGRFIALETKMPGKRETQTKIQKFIEAKIRRAGGVSQVVTSVGEAMAVCFPH